MIPAIEAKTNTMKKIHEDEEKKKNFHSNLVKSIITWIENGGFIEFISENGIDNFTLFFLGTDTCVISWNMVIDNKQENILKSFTMTAPLPKKQRNIILNMVNDEFRKNDYTAIIIGWKKDISQISW